MLSAIAACDDLEHLLNYKARHVRQVLVLYPLYPAPGCGGGHSAIRRARVAIADWEASYLGDGYLYSDLTASYTRTRTDQ